jgi:hypothetical protein
MRTRGALSVILASTSLLDLGLTTLIWFYCYYARAVSANSDVNAGATMVLPQPFPQDERAGYTAIQCQSTLAQRKHAILEHFRTSQVTMVRNGCEV